MHKIQSHMHQVGSVRIHVSTACHAIRRPRKEMAAAWCDAIELNGVDGQVMKHTNITFQPL